MSHDPYSALRYPEFRAFLGGMGAVFTATQIQSAVIGWQVYELTGDPLSLGLVGLAEAIPFLGLTLFGGWAADRFERRGLAWAGLAFTAVSAVLLVAVSSQSLRSALPLYAAQVLAGIGRAVFRPAAAALGADLVPQAQFHNASSWRSSFFHAAMVVGPAVGGGLIAWGGPRLAYAVTLVLMVGGLVALLRLRPRPVAPPTSEGVWSELVDGVRFVFRHPVLLGALSLDLFAVLFGGASALLPVFAREILSVDEVGFGFLRAAPAVGSVVMSLVLVRLGQLERAGPTLLWCVAGFGASWIVFAFSESYLLSLTLLAVGGALDNVSVVLRSVCVQTFTPREKMGRVSAVNGFFIGSSNELGAFESGVAARLLGTVPSVVFGGIMTLLTVAVVSAAVPTLRKLKRITA